MDPKKGFIPDLSRVGYTRKAGNWVSTCNSMHIARFVPIEDYNRACGFLLREYLTWIRMSGFTLGPWCTQTQIQLHLNPDYLFDY